MKKIVLLSLSVFAAFSLSAQQPRDWAQYGRYERQNAALAGEPVEVVFMGNSITDNWIGADPDFFARNGFVDRGISGQTTAEMLARFRRDVIDLNPVSYTHLDVYKRQSPSCTPSLRWLPCS